MQFLADVFLVCEACGGRRYEPRGAGGAVSRTEYQRGPGDDRPRGRALLRRPAPGDRRSLRLFEQIGLGYLRLGQPASSLSGGEAQRVKLAAHLLAPRTARPLRARRAHHGPSPGGRRELLAASGGSSTAGPPCSSSSTTWTWSSRRTGSSTWAPRRGRRGARRLPGHAGGARRPRQGPHGAVPPVGPEPSRGRHRLS